MLARVRALLFQLEHAKPSGSVHVDRQLPNRHLTRTIAEQGILYPFLLQTHRDARDGVTNATSRFTVGGTARSRYLPTPNSAAAAATKTWRGDPDAPRWPPAPTTTASRNGANIVNGGQTARAGPLSQRYPESPPPETRRTQPAHLQATLNLFSHPVPPSHPHHNLRATPPASVPALNLDPLVRPATPVLHLDLALAKTMMPKYEQDIGGCVWTNGVDPTEVSTFTPSKTHSCCTAAYCLLFALCLQKYRHPLLASHRIGWDASQRTLEFFPRHAQGARQLRPETLYGNNNRV